MCYYKSTLKAGAKDIKYEECIKRDLRSVTAYVYPSTFPLKETASARSSALSRSE
jgi:hypothetical protein